MKDLSPSLQPAKNLRRKSCAQHSLEKTIPDSLKIWAYSRFEGESCRIPNTGLQAEIGHSPESYTTDGISYIIPKNLYFSI
jgi:hypothetical protein